MLLGISTWSLPWSVGVHGYEQPANRVDGMALLAKATAAGVDVVQIADNLPLHRVAGRSWVGYATRPPLATCE